ncbi:phage portal protein [Rhodopseudomonas sp. B29]|uniref:phage portal protein n=1 Tax=Rhodopseudomonas sp. B29 TaxID=95607 RepID=UPI000345C764|nr:phage portal protein [Rhodopseudomonas sp. B29]
MSAFLKALAYVAPTAALRRAHALAALDASRGYDAAVMGRRGSSFKGTMQDSANGEIGPALHKMRERSSDLVRNTWIGSRIVDVLSAHVIGTGIHVAWRDKRLQDLWDEWCFVCDIEGERDFGGVQLSGFRSMLERGDAGVRMVPRKLDGGRTVPLALQVVEGDLIATERNGIWDGKKSRLGVVLGDWNEREGYWLYPEHPGEMMLSPIPKYVGMLPHYVPRSDFCHLYRILRAGQVRGVPLLAPVTMAVRDYADTMDAVVIQTRMQACYGLVINSADPVRNMADAQTRKDDAGRNIESMSPGMVYRAKLGETVTPFSPSGNAQFEPVALSALMGIASGGLITYDQLTGDLRQGNYSSLKAGDRVLKRLVEQIQWLTLVPQLLHRVTDRWLQMAIMSGHVRARKTPYVREYVMPAVQPIDPIKDLKADILAVRSGRMSPQEFISAWGRDWRKVVEETREFWKAADGGDTPLVLDIDPRRVDQLGKSQLTDDSENDPADDDAGSDGAKQNENADA